MKTTLKLCAMAMTMLVANLSPATASAAENPMEFAGIEHNLYLECLQAAKDRSASPLVRLVVDCGYDPGIPTAEFAALYQPLIEMDPAATLAKRMSPYRARYSDYEFSYFERIDRIVETARDPLEANAMLVELEREAVAKLDVKSHSGANILGGLSVARHSLKYWSQQLQNDGGMTAARWPRWLRALTIVVSDIAGAVIAVELGAAAAAGTIASAASDAVGGLIP